MERNSCGPSFEISAISDEVNETFDSHISGYLRFTPEPSDFNICNRKPEILSLLRSQSRSNSIGFDSMNIYRRQHIAENIDRPSNSSTRAGTQTNFNFSNFHKRASSRTSSKVTESRCSSVNSMRSRQAQSVSPSRMTLVLDKVGRHDVTCLSRQSQQQLLKRFEGNKPTPHTSHKLSAKENIQTSVKVDRRSVSIPKIQSLNNYGLIYKVKKGTYDPLIHSKENIFLPDDELTLSIDKTSDLYLASQQNIKQTIQQKMRTLEERNQRGRKPPCPIRIHHSDPDPVSSSPFQKKEVDERYVRLTDLLDSISQQITESLNKSSVI